MQIPSKFNSIFERLSRPINSTECTIHNLLTNQDVFLNEVQDSRFRCSPVELYPMSQMLQLREAIPTRMWDESLSRDEIHTIWCQQIKNYKQLLTRGTYIASVLKNQIDPAWPLPLFGIHHNSLIPVLQITLNSELYQSGEGLNFLLHAISVIALQFYLLERNQWLQVVGERNQPLYDQLPPYICMFFMRYDLKRGSYAIPLDTMPLSEAASRFDYISFVSSVLNHMAPSINDWLHPHTSLRLTSTVIKKWCDNKLFVTKIQFFITSRFVHLRVDRFSDALLQSLQIDNAPSANAIVSDGLTKHFKLVKHHKMHELRFHGKDPMFNSESKYDERNSSASVMALHQTRVPTFLAHFHFSPVAPITSHSRFSPHPSLWTDPDVKPQTRGLALKWLFDALCECSKLIDSTLCKKVRKSLNRLARQWKNEYGVNQVYSHKLVSTCSLVRVRYAYTIDEYQMITELAGALQLPRESEFSPQFISNPQWESLFQRVCHQPPFHKLLTCEADKSADPRQLESFAGLVNGLQQRKYYKLEQLAIAVQPDTFEYYCVLQACYVASSKDAVSINWWVVWHGLCMVYGNEHESLQNTLQLFPDKDPLLLRRQIVQDFISLKQTLATQVQELTLHQDLRQLIMKRWSFHSPALNNQPTESEWEQLTGIELTRWCWLKIEQEDWTMCSEERQFEIDVQSELHEDVLALRSHWRFLLSGFFRLFCPVPLIPANTDQTWQALSSFEHDWPQCTALLNSMIGRIRSAAFLHELETQLQTTQQQEQSVVNELPRATLEAALHVVKTLNQLLSSSDHTNQSEKYLLKQLTTLCHFQTNEVGTQQLEVLQKIKRRFAAQLRFGDRSKMLTLIAEEVVPELSAVFAEDVLMDRTVQVLKSVPCCEQTSVDLLRRDCISLVHQPTSQQSESDSARKLKLALGRAWIEEQKRNAEHAHSKRAKHS